MPQILVRNLHKDVVARLKARAQLHKRSLQAEVLKILEEVVAPSPRSYWREVDEFRARFAGRVFTDSADLIREDRER